MICFNEPEPEDQIFVVSIYQTIDNEEIHIKRVIRATHAAEIMACILQGQFKATKPQYITDIDIEHICSITELGRITSD